jgi:uncharacterized protein (DUF952 family)
LTNILHFCPEADWRAAQAAGEYRHASLTSDGFIHLSQPYQVHIPANTLMHGRTDLVLLEVDPETVSAPLRWEPGDPAHADSMRFPHLYGPLDLDAVVAVHPFPCRADGSFELPDSVPS